MKILSFNELETSLLHCAVASTTNGNRINIINQETDKVAKTVHIWGNTKKFALVEALKWYCRRTFNSYTLPNEGTQKDIRRADLGSFVYWMEIQSRLEGIALKEDFEMFKMQPSFEQQKMESFKRAVELLKLNPKCDVIKQFQDTSKMAAIMPFLKKLPESEELLSQKCTLVVAGEGTYCSALDDSHILLKHENVFQKLSFAAYETGRLTHLANHVAFHAVQRNSFREIAYRLNIGDLDWFRAELPKDYYPNTEELPASTEFGKILREACFGHLPLFTDKEEFKTTDLEVAEFLGDLNPITLPITLQEVDQNVCTSGIRLSRALFSALAGCSREVTIDINPQPSFKDTADEALKEAKKEGLNPFETLTLVGAALFKRAKGFETTSDLDIRELGEDLLARLRDTGANYYKKNIDHTCEEVFHLANKVYITTRGGNMKQMTRKEFNGEAQF